jgi:hypothetical protein
MVDSLCTGKKKVPWTLVFSSSSVERSSLINGTISEGMQDMALSSGVVMLGAVVNPEPKPWRACRACDRRNLSSNLGHAQSMLLDGRRMRTYFLDYATVGGDWYIVLGSVEPWSRPVLAKPRWVPCASNPRHSRSFPNSACRTATKEGV